MVVLNVSKKTRAEVPHKDPAMKRSAQSKFGRFLNDSKTKIAVTGAGVLVALGLTFIPPVNVAHAEGKKGKDKGAEVKKEKEKIDINALKGYTEGKYEDIVENESGFFFDVAVKDPILMEDGKKAVKIVCGVSYEEEKLKLGGDKASYVMVLLFDTEIGGKSEAGWIIDLEDLRAEYKEMTGKELKYVHALVEHDEGSSGEFLQLYLIPASSKKAVEKEIIEPDMPIKVLNLKLDTEDGKYRLNTYSNIVTASVEQQDNKVLAKK